MRRLKNTRQRVQQKSNYRKTRGGRLRIFHQSTDGSTSSTPLDPNAALEYRQAIAASIKAEREQD